MKPWHRKRSASYLHSLLKVLDPNSSTCPGEGASQGMRHAFAPGGRGKSSQRQIQTAQYDRLLVFMTQSGGLGRCRLQPSSAQLGGQLSLDHFKWANHLRCSSEGSYSSFFKGNTLSLIRVWISGAFAPWILPMATLCCVRRALQERT